MTREQIQGDVESALATVEPTEVRIHFEDADVLSILILSPLFKDVGMFKRITQCIELICDHAEEVSEKYTFVVEPVTAEEFKDRLVPWPE